ncbi:MAG: prepilin peptidase [Planctomycetes bacterium]|nr:prepilin peptidase [Planctomycetota bacterium]
MIGNTPVEGISSLPAAMGWCVVLCAALVAAAWDVRTGRIPNFITLPLLACGLLVSTSTGGVFGLVVAIESALLLALPCFILFVFAGGGAGDVKLLGALGAWLTLHDAVFALICVASAGAVCGIISALLRGRLADVSANLMRIVRSFGFAIWSRSVRDAGALMPGEQSMQPMPYGVAICLGVWVAAGGRWLWHI